MMHYHIDLIPLRLPTLTQTARRVSGYLKRQNGFTLMELMAGAALLVIAIAALLGVLVQQNVLNEQARNLAWATNDASRVMEQLRKQNMGIACVTPNVDPPVGFASWDAWLADMAVGGGKSVYPNPAFNELIVVTPSGTDPLTVTVAVCWRHRNRILGECVGNGMGLAANPGAGGDPVVTESPAMLVTTMTCRE